jgi:molybdopterin-guanine dinucleotide biosynthesis protein A
MENKPVAVILAGGKSSRLGGMDKGLLSVNERTLVELCIANVRSQVDYVAISANRNLPFYRQFADIVVPDVSPQFPEYTGGPLAGILSVWLHLEQNHLVDTSDLLIIPCDMPLLPSDLVARFSQARRQQNHLERVVVAHDGNRLQPLVMLLPKSTKNLLEEFLSSGQRKAMDWLRYCDALIADFSDESENFININTQADATAVEEKTLR